MKRLLTFLSLNLILLPLCFAQISESDYFSNRFFELKADVPVQLSNNYFSISDIFGTEDGTVVIDLKDMADSLPKSGFNLAASASPTVGFDINARKFGFGVLAGLDASANVTVGKELFDFLGYGNELYEDINVDGNANIDLFAYAKVPVAFNIKKLEFLVAPSMFIPIVHGVSDDFYATVSNKNDGTIAVNAAADLSLYSIIALSEIIDDEGNFIADATTVSTMLANAFQKKTFGFDLEGAVGWNMSDNLKLSANYRFPIVPGKLNYKTPYNYSLSYEATASTISEATPDSSSELGDTEDCTYYINRPLKVNIAADFKPFHNNYFVLSAMGGLGVRHPFSSEVVYFPEYSFGLKSSLASILTAKLKTSYIEQVFIHQVTLGLNVRVIELDVGISSQSSSFVSAFKGSGLGAFVTLHVGF